MTLKLVKCTQNHVAIVAKKKSTTDINLTSSKPLFSVWPVWLCMLGPQYNQGKWFYREEGFTEWSCVSTLPPDQEAAPAWQRQSGPGAERDSCSDLGMGLTGTRSGACWAETVQRGSRELFLVMFMNGYQEQDLIKKYLFLNKFWR